MARRVEAARRANLKDVAAKAGVSIFTASRALSGHAGVAKETEARVKDTARRLGYVANQHARSLKGSRSAVVGVVVASKTNQYYATLVGALEDAVAVDGYSCFVADAVTNGVYLPEREDRIIESMIQQRVAAVVVTYVIDQRNLDRLAAWNIPVLFVDCPPTGLKHPYPSVSSDNFQASRAMGDHLGSLGYRSWCFVGHARNWNTREPRQRGFEAAAAQWQASVTIIEGGNDAEVSRRAVSAFLATTPAQERPQAMFATNTVLLEGVLLALRDYGIKIPNDMAVAAFDDFDWAPLLDPPMTVVDQHIALIGTAAARSLLTILGNGEDAGAVLETVVQTPTLRIRESCGERLRPTQRPGSQATRKVAQKRADTPVSETI